MSNILFLTLLVLLTISAGCDDTGTEDGKRPPLPAPEPATLPITAKASDQPFREQFAQQLHTRHREAVEDVRALCETTRLLVTTPTPANLSLTRSRWRQAHLSYRAAATLDRLAGFRPDPHADIWPILGGYVDRAPGYPHSGIVYDTTFEITAESLLAQHQLTDTSEVSVGFHVLEYLLWGDPENEHNSAEAFRKSGETGNLEEEARVRRSAYLQTACQLLHEQLQAVQQSRSASTHGLTDPAALLQKIAMLLRVELGTKQLAPLVNDSYAERECVFSGQPLCGLTPAIQESLKLLSAEPLFASLSKQTDDLSAALTKPVQTLTQRMSELESDWPEEVAAQQKKFARLAEALTLAAEQIEQALAVVQQQSNVVEKPTL